MKQVEFFFKKGIIESIIPGSSNGRTTDFGSVNLGSNPNPGTLRQAQCKLLNICGICIFCYVIRKLFKKTKYSHEILIMQPIILNGDLNLIN